MKANAPKRKIFNDALDLLGGADVAPALENGVQMLPIDGIRPFRKHSFRLYEGDRLDDMVESIREHGVWFQSLYGSIRTDMKCCPGITGRWQGKWLA